MVVVCQFFAVHDILLGEDQDVVLTIDDRGLGVTVSLTGVIEITSLSSEKCCIYDMLVIYFEEIAIADTFLFVAFLALVSNLVADNLSHIFDQYVALLEFLLSEEPDSMNLTLTNFKLFGVLYSLTVLSR